MRKRGRKLAARVLERQRRERRALHRAVGAIVSAFERMNGAVVQVTVTLGSVESRIRQVFRDARIHRRKERW
jgi:hypothetical protein